MKKIAKAKAGKSLGMKSVKAGYDNNPGVTRADIIVAAKKKAQDGTAVSKAKMKLDKKIGKLSDKALKQWSKSSDPFEGMEKSQSKFREKANKAVDKYNKKVRVSASPVSTPTAKKGASVKKAVGKCKYGC